jgi:hypothetical protein
MNFWLATAALLLGPIIYGWARGVPIAKQTLDGFVLVAVAGIVCVDIIPSAIGTGGWLAIAALGAGLGFPVAVEKIFHRSVHRAHLFIVLLAALGLVIHAVIDGVALLPGLQENLAASEDGTRAAHAGSIFHNSLALGVVLHRLPVGMALWWSVRPNFGTPAAVMTFVLLIVATGLSYLFGAPVVELASTQSLALFQAFVAGSLVHVVAFGVSHRHAGDEAFVPADNWGFRAGILLGMFVVFALPRIF